MRHAAHESTAYAEQPSRHGRAARLVRALLKKEIGRPPDAVARLPFRTLEQRDSAGRALRRKTLENGARTYLDGNPMANETAMGRAIGVDNIRLLGVIKGLPPVGGIVPPNTPEARHLDELNTICILEELTPDGRPFRVVVTNMSMLQEARQDVARGEQPSIPPNQVRTLLPGQSLRLGRGENSWLPYKSSRDTTPDTPSYLLRSDRNISQQQAVIVYEPDLRVLVADGLGVEGQGSWNGTQIVQGSEAVASNAVPESYPVVGIDPWAGYEQLHGETQFIFPENSYVRSTAGSIH